MGNMEELAAVYKSLDLSKAISHHGVKGQKWGVRNGPPYPLKDGGSSRKIGEKKPGVFKRAFTALDERRKKRKKDKMASSMKKLYKNRKKFTPEEIEERIKMFDLEQKIVDRKNTELDRPRKFINIMLGYGKSLKEAYKLINPDSGGGGGNNNNNNDNSNNEKKDKKKDKPQRKSFQDQWLENIKKEEKMINARLALRQAKDREKDYKKKRKSMKHSDEVSDFLAHHGVQGQKWGVRNGPPYPLDSSVSTGKKLKKGGASSKGDNKKPDEKKRREGMIMVPITPSALPLYAGAAAVMFGAALTKKMLRKNGKKKIDAEYESNTTVDKKSGLKKKTREMTEKEDLKRVNPDYGTSWNAQESAKSSNNCTNCTYAYELRRRGFDVRAGLLSEGRHDTEAVTKALFKGAEFNKKYAKEPKDVTFADELKAQKGMNRSLYKNVKAELEKQPKGSRGQLIVHWDKYSGHSVNYVINDKGKVEIHEAQRGTKRPLAEYLIYAVDAKWARLDDKQANYSQFKKKGAIR